MSKEINWNAVMTKFNMLVGGGDVGTTIKPYENELPSGRTNVGFYVEMDNSVSVLGTAFCPITNDGVTRFIESVNDMIKEQHLQAIDGSFIRRVMMVATELSDPGITDDFGRKVLRLSLNFGFIIR